MMMMMIVTYDKHSPKQKQNNNNNLSNLLLFNIAIYKNFISKFKQTSQKMMIFRCKNALFVESTQQTRTTIAAALFV